MKAKLPAIRHGLNTEPVDRPIEVYLRPGIHLIELTVEFPMNIVQQAMLARHVVLIDDDSHIALSAYHPLMFSSANKTSDFRWQTDSSITRLTADWSGHFFNSFIKLQPWLLYAITVPASGYNIAEAPLSFDGVKTFNGSGILAFNVALCKRNNGLYQPLETVALDGLNQSYSFMSGTLSSGEAFRAEVTATDIFGHKRNDSVFVMTDFTAPQIVNLQIWERSEPSINDATVCSSASQGTGKRYSIESEIVDVESGVDHVEWMVGSNPTLGNLANGTVSNPTGIDKADCLSTSCLCSLDNFCSNRKLVVELGRLPVQSAYHVTLVATNRAGLVRETQMAVSVQRETIRVTLNSAASDSPSSLIVRWSADSSDPGHINYTVTVCRRELGGQCRVCVDHESLSNALRVRALSAYTIYVIQVQAETSSSSGLSGIVVNRTMEGGTVVYSSVLYNL